MSARRFEVKRVFESDHHPSSQAQPSEIIPLIHVENEIPTAPPLPASIFSTNSKNSNRISPNVVNTILKGKSLDTRRRATIAAAKASGNNQMKKSSSAEIIHPIESISIPSSQSTNHIHVVVGNEGEDSDAYSTIQSTNNDTYTSRLTNKFLQELRLKRRELRDKGKNLPIDQRIASHRREIRRAQDIFDVHFPLAEEEDPPPCRKRISSTKKFRRKIRQNIFQELDRQRSKQYHKHHRHLFLGRILLILMTSLLAIMSCTLIYVVTDLYDRAKYLELKLPENEFIPLSEDKTTDFS